MARIVYSALVTHINGSIAGTTFQRNAYGFTVKKKPTQVQPTTALQQVYKTNLQRLSGFWQGMSLTIRNSWDSYALANPVPSRLNPTSFLTGHAQWIRTNLIRQISSSSLILTSPTNAQDTLNTGTVEVQRVGATLIYFNDSDSVLNTLTTFAFLSSVSPNSRSYDRSRTRWMGAFGLPGADQIDITAAYTAKFGSIPVAGEHLFLRIIYLNGTNGQVIFVPPTLVTVV
jgi:hypothetical protein